MVTINLEKWTGRTDGNGKSLYYREGECLKDDAKPTEGYANGSKLLVIDDSKLIVFDEENQKWEDF